ncbi:MAG: lysophospholipid acyltransferase family protein [Verrucomicrobiota bacterium]
MPASNSSQEPARKSIRELTGPRLAAVSLLGLLARLWCASLRIKPDEEALRILADERPTVFVLWHNRLFTIGEVHRRFRRPHVKHPIYGLISASRDGAWLTGFFQKIGIQAIRGSSSWRGTQAVREAVKILEDSDLGITPDGPRGPCYDFKPGAALIARKSNCPVALLGMSFAKAKRLKSWDAFYLPMPFSVVELRGRIAKIDPKKSPSETIESLKLTLEELSRDQ